MRNATILVVNLRGVATETIKNIVLAGIGKLIIWDSEDVATEDLGVGFFFRDEDVGKKVRQKFIPLFLSGHSRRAHTALLNLVVYIIARGRGQVSHRES
jgi:molybdopterin/thiamine biosynthesis adenylyltransferase